MEREPIKVLIVDDSVLMRKLLQEIINSAPDMTVVGTAADPIIARDKIKLLNPDVITLDVEMPNMDGLTFLKNLMRLRPMPVVMISTLTSKGATETLEALELGAVDYIAKPKIEDEKAVLDISSTIQEKVRMAATARVSALEKVLQRSSPSHVKDIQDVNAVLNPDYVLAIGASTGGTEAIKALLSDMPPRICPTVISQHIPEAFSASFAQRMDRSCNLNVSEAEDGDVLLPGHVYIAPGHSHLKVKKVGGKLVCKLSKSERVNLHRPSVEVMFDSVREALGDKVVGVMLTGMGSDGAEAMLRLKQAGAHCIVQDEDTSVVWGMPGAAHQLGAADEVLALSKIAPAVVKRLRVK